ncbi:MAG TPA: oxygen-insensitive NAD(P)H nitroreductase, partial [Cellvibrionaceae bacterium]|nr:oxygen-insensitive NAD(P)H nitroreductase [Cellvibrionaceae bacterium]
PSSTNSQPWHFVLAHSPAGKAQVATAAHGTYASNASKINNSSLCVVFCAKTDLSDDYLAAVLNQEEQDGRFAPNPAFKQSVDAGRKMYADLHRQQLNDAQHWMEKQVYLNMGFFLLGTAALGLDAVPIEGIDRDVLNRELHLTHRGLTGVALVAVGYGADTDFNASLPKSRFAAEQIMSFI